MRLFGGCFGSVLGGSCFWEVFLGGCTRRLHCDTRGEFGTIIGAFGATLERVLGEFEGDFGGNEGKVLKWLRKLLNLARRGT